MAPLYPDDAFNGLPHDFDKAINLIIRYHKRWRKQHGIAPDSGDDASIAHLPQHPRSHALRRGFDATLYTYNLDVFDPTWFVRDGADISERLSAQMREKDEPKLNTATKGYLEFLALGGEIRFEDLTTALIRKYLNRSIPILTGLSATYLYRSIREVGLTGADDDVRGEPAGHFVVFYGYDRLERSVLVADPFEPNPVSGGHYYSINIDRALCSILLGVLTHDADFLIIRPKKERGI